MRKFKHKKILSLVVIFLLVFIMAGAFATFQTILDVRGRINMYAPTVDAIISNVTPVAAPIAAPGAIGGAPGMVGFHTTADPSTLHDQNPPVRGPWSAGARFNPRVFVNTAWGAEVAPILIGGGAGAPVVAAGHVPYDTLDASVQADARLRLNDFQTVIGVAAHPTAGAGVLNAAPTTHLSGVATTGIAAANRDRVNTLAWWAWGHQGAEGDTYDSGSADTIFFAQPQAARVEEGTIADPSLFETLYLNLTFDQFSQFYYFLLELANVGVVPLEVTDVRIARVADPTAATPAWTTDDGVLPIPGNVLAMLQAGTMHPVWATMPGVDYSSIPYTVNDAIGALGLVNVTVDRNPTIPGATSGWTGTQLIIPPVSADPLAPDNTVDVGLRFCVEFENWEVFIYNWETWLPGFTAIETLVDAILPGTLTVGTADLTDQTQSDAVLSALLDVLMLNALSGTFRIEYTVVPSVAAVTRPPSGVLPTP